MGTEQPGYVRTNNGRILREDSPEAQSLDAVGKLLGPTATINVVEFVKKWTSPSGRVYQIGDFEKFGTDPASVALLQQLKTQGTVRSV